MVLLNSNVASNPLYEALLLIGLCLLLIVFALLRNTVQRWLTKVVFRRPDFDKILRELRSGPALLLGEADYLAWAAQRLALFMGASRSEAGTGQEACFTTLTGTEVVFPAPVAHVPSLRHDPVFEWAEVFIPVRLGPGELRYILLGRRQGGRRYLSEDLQALSRLSTAIAEQVDHFRTSEMQRLVSQAELRALQSQMNPRGEQASGARRPQHA